MKATLKKILTITACAALLATATLTTYSATQAAHHEEEEKNSMIGVMVTLTAVEGEEEFVAKQMAWFASQCIEKEPGTLLYTIVADEKSVRTFEIYKDQEAFAFHGATAHHEENVQAFAGKIADFGLQRFSVVNHPTR
jgi:quinol monooxygenase YgiN